MSSQCYFSGEITRVIILDWFALPEGQDISMNDERGIWHNTCTGWCWKCNYCLVSGTALPILTSLLRWLQGIWKVIQAGRDFAKWSFRLLPFLVWTNQWVVWWVIFVSNSWSWSGVTQRPGRRWRFPSMRTLVNQMNFYNSELFWY